MTPPKVVKIWARWIVTMKYPWCVLLVVCLALSARGAEQPNILYILADDLGYSDLGCFGGEINTPVLNSLAAGGVRLTQFYNTGRCCPSRAALLTGQYPHRVGLGHMTTNDLGRPGYRGVVSDQAPTNEATGDRPQRHEIEPAFALAYLIPAAWDQWGAENHVTPLPRDLGVKYLKAD